MKVAHIIGSLNRGGIENLLLDIFKNTGEAIHLICIHRKRGVLYEDFLRTEIPMYELPVQKHSVFIYHIKLRKLLIKEKVAIAHCHQPIDAFLTYLATIGTKIKIVLTLHDHGMKNGFVGDRIRKFVIRHANAALFVSHFTKRYYLNKFNFFDQSNFYTLWNGLDFEKFRFEKNNFLKKELGIQKNTSVFVTVGSFSSGRDQMTICRFLAKLVQKRDDFLFLFIGAKSSSEPELFDNCASYCQQNNLENNVKFLGVRQDVPQILPQIDAFIYSSVHDTFGIAIIEAIYSGIPAFLNDWEVMMEITNNGEYATIYDTKNEDDLLCKFTHFLENKDEYTQKAKLAKEFVTNNYSINSHIINLKRIYQAVLNI